MAKAAPSKSNSNEYDVTFRGKKDEVQTIRDLMVGTGRDLRWARSYSKTSLHREVLKCAKSSKCSMNMVVVKKGNDSYIKTSKGKHKNHSLSKNNGLAVAFHFNAEEEMNVAAGVVVPDTNYESQNIGSNNSTSSSSLENVNNSFPISATISALQMPSTLNNLEENKELNEETRKNINEETYEDFPGIRRENRPKHEFIWRPEENQKDEEINEDEEEEELKNKNISIIGEKLRKKRRDAKTTNLDLIERVEENKDLIKLENKSNF
uniref:Transposase MuDR plant domain-containing protein n=1 Tax=Meloidogyne hapla TaxID=6305 RepID=A0A1I8BBF8_MELHA